MKFLVDAQLPQRLARWLQAEGHQAVHTRDLPDDNRTADATLNEISIRDSCVLVTKDEDFVDTFLLRRANPTNCFWLRPATFIYAVFELAEGARLPH